MKLFPNKVNMVVMDSSESDFLAEEESETVNSYLSL